MHRPNKALRVTLRLAADEVCKLELIASELTNYLGVGATRSETLRHLIASYETKETPNNV